MLARFVRDTMDHHRLIVVDDDSTTATTFQVIDPDTTDTFNLNTCDSVVRYCSTFLQSCEEEPPPEPHINGDLTYLYRRQFPRPPVQKRTNYRHPLRIPCWRAGRWKSLT